MKLGFFTMPVHPKERNYTETLKEDREAFILADKLGYVEGLCGEHLTDQVENIPNAMMFLASLVGVTAQIRLGTAVANIPYSHPVVVASNAAMLDHLLQGRFMLGIGHGILRSDAEAMGLIDQDRTAMMAECIDQVIAIWEGEPPYNLTGKYWNVSTAKSLWPEIGLGTIAKPYQKPHPPILCPASDPNSKGLTLVGKRGWFPISSNFTHANWLKSHWVNYAAGCAEAGRKATRENWRIGRSIFVAEDDKTALAYGKSDANSPYRFYMSQLSQKLKKARGLRNFKSHEDMSEEAVTLDYILDNIVIAGSVNSVVDQILALYEMTGGFGTLFYVGKNWTDPGLGRKSMELMAEKVLPKVNAAIGTSP